MITTHICLTIQQGHKCDKQQTSTFPTEPDIYDDFYSPLHVFIMKSLFISFLQKPSLLNVNTDKIVENIRGLLLIYLGVITVLKSFWRVFFLSHYHLEICIEIFTYFSYPIWEGGVDGIQMKQTRHELVGVEPGCWEY